MATISELGPWREKPLGKGIISHDAQGCHRTSHKVQNLSRACQDLPYPNQATNLDYNPAFSALGIEHTRGPCPLEGANAEGTQLHLAVHNL